MTCPRWTFLPLALTLLTSAQSEEKPLEKIAFVSCLKEARDAPALGVIADWKPDAFIWMGDNIYGDSSDPAVLAAKYELVRKKPRYQDIIKSGQVVGTWDDHDYGKNDAGKEFEAKKESQQAFLDFLDVPADSPRRTREGVYHFEDFGPEGRQVRIILLDTRYHRDPIGSDGDLLGEAQWEWLQEALSKSPAEVNILVSSIQVLASDHRFEKWSNFPSEKARLFQLLGQKGMPAVVILSGDRHLGEISVDRESLPYPLFDITSSSLNSSFGGSPEEVNRFRIGRNYGRNNYGTLTLDWSGQSPVIKAVVRDQEGEAQLQQEVVLPLSQ